MAALTGAVNLGFMVLPIYRGWVIVASLIVCLAVWALIEKTRLGATLRAATENPTLVQSFGINVPMLLTLTYALGAGLAALAGVLAAPIYQVSPLMGSNIIIVVFAVVVVGGMGSIPGAALGAPGQLGLQVPALQVHLSHGDRQADTGALRLGQVDAGGVEAVAAPDGLLAQPPQVGAHRHRRPGRAARLGGGRTAPPPASALQPGALLRARCQPPAPRKSPPPAPAAGERERGALGTGPHYGGAAAALSC